ncbi:putative methyltransferase DDB_G0268948 isoform X2 [Oratosquilla oratoria]|uniref:putative methyltransferase DDB_G0268948 isoform X2 n=1 Tax=Oratosquilla oratoria TaxID=337810 RepID=UPI003F75784D
MRMSAFTPIPDLSLYAVSKSSSYQMAGRYFEGVAHAALYAKFRPIPPPSLVNRITSYLKEKYKGPLENAVDVGCGSGQSTGILSNHFKNVVGFDISEAQVAEAVKQEKSPNVTYKVSGAESLLCEKESLQLVSAGQACHWFDIPKFFAEADRVLVPGGVIALYGYHLPKPIWEGKSEKLNQLILDVYSKETGGPGGYWGSGRADVDAAYTDKKFHIPYLDFERDDSLYLDRKATVADLKGYISSWSGFQNYRADKGDEAALNVLNTFESKFMDELGVDTPSSETELTLRITYYLLMGRKPLA